LSTECPTSSYAGTERSNPQGEARHDELVSRNVSKLDSASLRYVGMAMLPKMLKPVDIGEETFVCNRCVPRGDWRRRVRKEKSRNLRDPALGGPGWESDVPIVVRKPGNAGGAKGDNCKYATMEVWYASA